MKELQPLIEQIVSLVKDTKDFVLAQAPDFVRQFIVYSYIQAFVCLAVGIAALIACALAIKYARNHWNVDRYDNLEPRAIIACIVAPLFGIGGILSVFCETQELLTIWLAPKIYIVMNIASVVHHQ